MTAIFGISIVTANRGGSTGSIFFISHRLGIKIPLTSVNGIKMIILLTQQSELLVDDFNALDLILI